jgi:hypothetical protein
MNLITALKNDENGFVVSAELVLVGTICVLGMIVGLTELSYGVNEELEDLGSAVGNINQTYYFTLASGKKGEVVGSTNPGLPGRVRQQLRHHLQQSCSG